MSDDRLTAEQDPEKTIRDRLKHYASGVYLPSDLMSVEIYIRDIQLLTRTVDALRRELVEAKKQVENSIVTLDILKQGFDLHEREKLAAEAQVESQRREIELLTSSVPSSPLAPSHTAGSDISG